MAVGPRLILTCAHCLTAISTRTRRALIYNEQYWVQPNIKLERSGIWSGTGRIPVTLFKYHVENDWALLIRTDDDGAYFEHFAAIDMTPSTLGESQLPLINTVDVLHCPVKLLVGNFETHAEEYTLRCSRRVNSVVQSQSSHHLYYDSSGITSGSSGGAVHVSGSALLFAMHCERIGEVPLEVEQSKKIEDPEGKRVDSEEYPYEEVADQPVAKKARKASDSESIVRSVASGNEGQGRAIIVSQYKRLTNYISEINNTYNSCYLDKGHHDANLVKILSCHSRQTTISCLIILNIL